MSTAERVGRLEELLAALERLPDPVAREAGLEAVQSVVELYGEALGRVMAHANGLAAELAADELVGHLLLVHDLHPVPVEERVRGALEEVAPLLGSHGGGIQLVSVAEGVATVRLEGACDGCAASAATLRSAVEEAVLAAAPELEAVQALDPSGARPTPQQRMLQIQVADGLAACPAGPELPVL